LIGNNASQDRVRRIGIWGLVALATLLGTAAAPAEAITVIRMIAGGGGPYTDSSSNVWSTDSGYHSSPSGTVDWTIHPISGTTDDTLYQHERYDNGSGLTYAFTVPNGTYLVRLHWAENYVNNTFPNGGVGFRIINATVEGTTPSNLQNIDLFSEAGEHAAVARQTTVTVSDGQLNINVGGTINAIEIIEQTDTSAPTAPTGLTATAASSSQINLSWTASTDNIGVTGYVVLRCATAGCTPTAQIATPTATSYSDAGLSASTSYSYRVRAQDAATNESSNSSTATATTSASTGTTIRVIAAGSSYTDSLGHAWTSDAGYHSSPTGTVDWSPQAISGTTDDTIYQHERYNNGSGLTYAFTVPNGTYQVRFHWSENYVNNSFPNGGVGYRVFGVAVEGTTPSNLQSIDLYAEAGDHAAIVKQTTVTVTDGVLNIDLHDTINAIEVIGQGSDTDPPTVPANFTATAVSSSQINLSWTASTDDVGVTGYLLDRCQTSACSFSQIATPTGTTYSDTGLSASTGYTYRVRARDAVPRTSGYSGVNSATTQSSGGGGGTTVRVNAGGPAYTDGSGHSWSADTGYNTGSAMDWGAVSISGTSNPTLYRTERWDDSPSPEMQYAFTVVNGNYEVKLHFAENYASASGQRVFDVDIEGVRRFDDIDIFAEAGAGMALIRSTTVTVTDGQINIAFLHQTENPLINAIEILPQTGSDTQAPTTPTDLSATAVSASQINLSWTASTDAVGVTAYLLERCLGSGCSSDFTQIANQLGTTFSDTGRSASTSYTYKVRARDAADNRSNYSTTATATTSSGTNQPPSQPGGLTVTPGTTSMNLSWNASTDDVEVIRYVIRRCVGASCNSNWQQLGTTTALTFADSNLSAGVNYTYQVLAEDGSNQQAASASVAGTMTNCD
jgi:chitodextrinase